eukprot:CAMPEP_0168615806 /NCGR_PEP_ID=MMETSP0449_2-20121227/4695_1 /TAXON_ID=1082188 /ORGANISM="Strombidium rassoulzadegani, Strain ras09" /LENGTH=141 /DNA_ID=CAMNT_0008656559 /DNA_START=717 /DNA_END=1142 /DNA_ORIENTATION=+
MVLGLDSSHVIKGLGCEASHSLVVCRFIVSELQGGLEVGGRINVGVIEHGDDAHEDGLDSDNGPPSLVGPLLRVELVDAGWVKNGDADLAILVDVRVPHLRLERHHGRVVGEVVGELQLRLEETSLVERVLRPLEYYVPQE